MFVFKLLCVLSGVFSIIDFSKAITALLLSKNVEKEERLIKHLEKFSLYLALAIFELLFALICLYLYYNWKGMYLI